MNLDKGEIQNLDRILRLNLINSITGIKPANLVGSISQEGHTNIAIISSVIHLGSDPALIGFVMRPSQEVRRDTYENIISTSEYTINHIHESFIEQAHYTSAKFERYVSEFDQCGLHEEYLNDYRAPFVKESKIKIGLNLVEIIPIKINDTCLIIGEIGYLEVADKILNEQGFLDLGIAQDVGISGLNSYYKLSKLTEYPYARVNDVPDFSKK